MTPQTRYQSSSPPQLTPFPRLPVGPAPRCEARKLRTRFPPARLRLAPPLSPRTSTAQEAAPPTRTPPPGPAPRARLWLRSYYTFFLRSFPSLPSPLEGLPTMATQQAGPRKTQQPSNTTTKSFHLQRSRLYPSHKRSRSALPEPYPTPPRARAYEFRAARDALAPPGRPRLRPLPVSREPACTNRGGGVRDAWVPHLPTFLHSCYFGE